MKADFTGGEREASRDAVRSTLAHGAPPDVDVEGRLDLPVVEIRFVHDCPHFWHGVSVFRTAEWLFC